MNAAAREQETGSRWVLFSLDAGRFALPLDSVERIVHAAEITPLPQAPDNVAGAIDIAGEILPVYDLRRRFKLPAREVRVSDQFVVTRAGHRRVVLMVDAALGVHDSVGVHDSAQLIPAMDAAAATTLGVIPHADGLVLIQDLERFLSADETKSLEFALGAIRHREGSRRAR